MGRNIYKKTSAVGVIVATNDRRRRRKKYILMEGEVNLALTGLRPTLHNHGLYGSTSCCKSD